VQVLRGSRFADSWDGVGRRWIYLLPRPTAVEQEVHRLLWLQRVPLSVAQQIWRMATSWPLAAVHLETEPEPEIQPDEATVTTMVVHSAWPFNMLRVRRDPDPDSEVVALMPMRPPPHPPPEKRHKWQVLEADSTPEMWRLAPGSKTSFESGPGSLVKGYNEQSEGWVVRVYDGCDTLVPLDLELVGSNCGDDV